MTGSKYPCTSIHHRSNAYTVLGTQPHTNTSTIQKYKYNGEIKIYKFPKNTYQPDKAGEHNTRRILTKPRNLYSPNDGYHENSREL